MDEIPVQDMDASQLRELEEFNAQVKINAEALENHHKILEVELKKLRVESAETIVKMFFHLYRIRNKWLYSK